MSFIFSQLDLVYAPRNRVQEEFDIISGLFYETSISQLLLSSLPLIKPRRLTKEEQEAFSLSNDLKEIFVGLCAVCKK
jgi:hypothetical protein